MGCGSSVARATGSATRVVSPSPSDGVEASAAGSDSPSPGRTSANPPGGLPAAASLRSQQSKSDSRRRAPPTGPSASSSRWDPETPQEEARDRARDLTSILAQRLEEHQREEAQEAARQQQMAAQRQLSLSQRQQSQVQRQLSQVQMQISQSQRQQSMSQSQRRGKSDAGGASASGGGLAAELEALQRGGQERFEELMRDLMSQHTQVLLPADTNPEDAAALQAVSGCSHDQAVKLIECLTVVQAAADAIGPAAAAPPPDAPSAGDAADGDSALPQAAGQAAGASPGVGAVGAPSPSPASPGPSAQQVTRQLGVLAGLVNDVPGLRTAAMARDAAAPLTHILLLHTEKAAAANAALVLAALAGGPPPHKNSLIAGGIVDSLLQAARGKTAAAQANSSDAPGVAANACSALGSLATAHPAGAAAVMAAGGIEVLVALLDVNNAANVRTNAAGVLVQLTATNESYRAAVAAAGGVPALATGMLRGPEAPACNAVTALYNLAAMTPPSLRPAMATAGGPLGVVPQLLYCMSGRSASGAADESIAAAASARVNASAVLLELCKDPTSATQLADEVLAVPSALAALAAGRLPPAAGQVAAADILARGVDLLYPVPPVVRGNSLLCLMALARMGAAMQLQLGRCGALGTLLELLGPGQDPAMQINSANAICSLAAANADIHAALVAAQCVPLLAGLLLQGGDAARANVAAVLVTMMRDGDARQQMQECGALASLVRLAAALLEERSAAGVSGGGGGGGASSDPGGVLCNTVGALAEAAKHPDLRRGLMQVEFGESLGTLLRCIREGPEPAQVNAAAALCHLCREHTAAVQLGRLRGVEVLRDAVGSRQDDALPGSWTHPSSRLRHNASRALARLQEQLAAADEEAQAAATVRSTRKAATAAATSNKGGGATDGDGACDDATSDAGGGGGGGASTAADRTAQQSRDGPRAVWDLGQAEEPSGAAPPLASSSKTLVKAVSYEDDVDDLSTVITPPLPLAAF